MEYDSDQYLHRLVVAAVTVFVVVSLLMAAFITREIWLQEQIFGLSSTLEVNLAELEETTEEIQNKMSELKTTDESTPVAQNWDNVNDLLEDVDQQLESIEVNIDKVSDVSEADLSMKSVGDPQAEATESVRAQADQVFTIFAVLTGVAAVAIAVLLGMAMRVQENRQVLKS